MAQADAKRAAFNAAAKEGTGDASGGGGKTAHPDDTKRALFDFQVYSFACNRWLWL